MELVRGIKITDYCDEKNLSTRERLDLFKQVCQAVQHAHQKGIIHRDIKPSNILVTVNDGVAVPKIIDFGIAKATQMELTEKTVFTRFHQFIGTPAYMSPEQAEITSVDIDTRSDIYSLGVLLYELLTGKTPFDTNELLKAGLDEMRRTIREKEPSRPSTRVSTLNGEDLTTTAKRRGLDAPKLVNVLRGDLDWIVMKCLEKDRARRYETANGLASDIQRHLNNEPVIACPPSNFYKFQKLVHRNKVAVAAAASVTAALVIGLCVAAWQFIEKTRAYNRAVAAEKAARTEGAKSEQIANFLERMLAGVAPSVALGRDTTVLREILDKAATSLDIDLTNNPDAEQSLRNTLTGVYLQLGETSKAEEMQQKALATARKTYGEAAPETGYTLLGMVNVLMAQRHHEEAERAARDALEIFKKGPESKETDATVGAALDNVGGALRYQGRLEESAEAYQQSLGYKRKVFGNSSAPVANTLNNLANDVRDLGDEAKAESMFREVIEIRDGLRVPESDPERAMTLHNLAVTLELEGKLKEAVETRRKRIAILEKLAGDAQNFNAQSEVAAELVSLARLLAKQGDTEQANTCLHEHSTLLGRLAGTLTALRPPITTDLLRLRGMILARLGRWTEAAADFSQYCTRKPDDYLMWETLAAALVQIDDVDGYRRHCQGGFEHFQHTKSPDIADRVAKACLVLPDSGVDFESSAALAETALALEKARLRMPWHYFCKSLAEYRRENFSEAARWGQQTLAHATEPLAVRIWAVNDTSLERDACAYALLAMAQHRLGLPDQAKDSLRKGEVAEASLQNLDLENGPYAHALMRQAKELIQRQTKTFK